MIVSRRSVSKIVPASYGIIYILDQSDTEVRMQPLNGFPKIPSKRIARTFFKYYFENTIICGEKIQKSATEDILEDPNILRTDYDKLHDITLKIIRIYNISVSHMI